MCYSLDFGVAFQPEECIKWLNISAMGGYQPARAALPRFAQVFNNELEDYVVPTTDAMNNLDLESTTTPSQDASSIIHSDIDKAPVECRGGKFYVNGKVSDGASLLLRAAENAHYENIKTLLSNGVSGAAATDEGVTPLHFLSF